MRYKIGIVSPSLTMTEKFQTEIKARNLKNCLLRHGNKNAALHLAQELVDEGVRVFISRGQPASVIRNKLDLPVVDVRYTFFDCYNAYKLAKKFGNNVAFLATYGKFIQIIRKSIFLMQNAELVEFPNLDDAHDIQEKLLDLKKRGYKSLVGGLTLKERAEAHGFKYVMTETDEDSVRIAIDEAMHLLRIEMERDERAKELENRYETIVSIFQCVSDGVISIDRNGVVTNINNKAVQILGNQTLGKNIGATLKTGLFEEVLNSGTPVAGEVINVGHHSLVVNAEPIRLNNEIGGATVTLQLSKNILAAEKKIRGIMLDKGHKSDKTFDDIIGSSSALNATKKLARKYAAADSTVLILGETGTGKELFAQSIHNASRRRAAPFVAINCASLPLNILESELFGYVKGAFTGARSEGKAGFFELAHHGTMFLDEISETSLEVQLKLLRVIQERKTIRIGDDTLIPVDVRILTASNKDLTRLIRKGMFREDLYYRICVLELLIPPLRERRADIPDLVRYFMRHSTPHITHIDKAALKLIASEEWPGNVRQLQNLVERIGAICEDNAITRDVVEKALGGGVLATPLAIDSVEETAKEKHPAKKPVTESELIRKALLDVKGNRKLAAEQLGISTTTLWRRMKHIAEKDPAYFDLVKYSVQP